MKSQVIVELCVDDVAGVCIAREAGVDRVELCRSLDVGGLTPDLQTILCAVSEAPAGGLQVIVRSRAGDFTYTHEEIDTMCADLRRIRRATENADTTVGFVVGAVSKDGKIDREAAAAFREAAGERPLTFHRAFDVIHNQHEGIEMLVALGYERVLTTGGDIAVAQVSALRELVNCAAGRLQVIASGGVRSSNIAHIVSESCAPEVHMRAPGCRGGTDLTEVRRIMNVIGR